MSHSLKALLIVILLPGLADVILPPEASAEDRRVTVVATSILAVKEETRQELDPELAALREMLEELFKYGGYVVVDKAERTGDFETELEFGLPDNLVLRVKPRRGDAEGRIDLVAKLVRVTPSKKLGKQEEKSVLETELKLKEGGTVLLGGPSLEDGVLILALEAHAARASGRKR
jgi:hypothetical protein